ncbi:hypothetical protein TRKP067_4157 [Klebsiella pneumoniae]|nr:hypothetical protein TRKP33_4050 [Klebsiella pneumoniae]BBE63250.1 hypothetical protein TRKP064_4156 [Klebsiella pneumoniae]BBE68842.1 hypothetical protein TRKP067_4157 [Klebsiella pneumoniae]
MLRESCDQRRRRGLPPAVAVEIGGLREIKTIKTTVINQRYITPGQFSE